MTSLLFLLKHAPFVHPFLRKLIWPSTGNLCSLNYKVREETLLTFYKSYIVRPYALKLGNYIKIIIIVFFKFHSLLHHFAFSIYSCRSMVSPYNLILYRHSSFKRYLLISVSNYLVKLTFFYSVLGG